MKHNTSTRTMADWVQNSLLVKFFVIGLLILVLLFVNAVMVMGLIRERKELHQQATSEVAEKWGQMQTLTGPILAVPFAQKATDGQVYEKMAYILPEQLRVLGSTGEEIKKRGIHKIVLFKGDITLSGSFNTAISADLQGLPLQWERARLAVGISDLTGISQAMDVTFGNQKVTLQSGTGATDLLASGVSSVVSGIVPDQLDSFNIHIKLKGSNYLGFEPVGRETYVRLTSSWPSPSFTGKFITDSSSVSSQGFMASWRILDLSRPYPQQFIGGKYTFGSPNVITHDADYAAVGNASTSFGVNLMRPVNEYTKTERAAKYAVLIIALTFMIFFFTEMLRNVRFHPLQYLLVGLALSLFYVLLLSFSEHIGFNAAYLVASAATISLIAYYAGSTARSRTLGIRLATLLSVIFGFIFTILQMEDFALLAGSIGLFLALAAAMHFSRHVDWSRSKPLADDDPDE